MIQDEFRRCFQLYPRLYSQFVLTPDHNAPLSYEAWDAFTKAHERPSPQHGAEWDEWEVSPDRCVCSRLYGSGDRCAVKEFRRAAESGYDILVELQMLHEEEETTPHGFRLLLPEHKGPTGWRPVDWALGWLNVVYRTAFACPTPFLHADHGLWGHPDTARKIESHVVHAASHLDWERAHASLWEEAEERTMLVDDNDPVVPVHPPVQSLRCDVFRSSAEAINVWLNSDRTVWVAVEDEPPIWLPPSNPLAEEAADDLQLDHSNSDTSPPEAKNLTPVWDKARGTLTVGDVVVKNYSREATTAWKILDELEKEGWPPRTANPLGDNDHALRAAVNDLNKSLDVKNLIRFRTRAKGVTWELVKQP
jgi:hypothetical protein